jgi:hypothetical protein
MSDTSKEARTSLEQRIDQHIRAINEEFEAALREYSTVDELTEELKGAPA